MYSTSLCLIAATALCSSANAQQSLDASQVYPITSTVKDAGTFNVNSRRWVAPSSRAGYQSAIGMTSIFDNTCTWLGGAYYTGTGVCETYIDEGQIPGPDNLDFVAEGGVGATVTNNVVLFQFGYCTNFAVPDIKIGFYDSLGGRCSGSVPPIGNGQPTLAEQACPAAITLAGLNLASTAYYDMGLVGLPGDATPGGAVVSCWIINMFLGNLGFCLKSEGEGVWDNVQDLDRFNWSWQMDNVQPSGSAVSGLIVSGEPAALPNPLIFGACTYNLPCDFDPLTGSPCGTGRGGDDSFWINVDGDLPEGSTNTGVSCVSAPVQGTTCYWFGGYPGNPWGGFWMRMIGNGSCDGIVPVVNNAPCLGQVLPTVSQNCQSTVMTSGLPSFTSTADFDIVFGGLNVNTNGVVFYGLSGGINGIWSPQSFLCVKPPIQRLYIVPGASGNTGGASGSCNGSLSVNFNDVIQGVYPSLFGVPIASGLRVDVQAWQRDPPSIKTTNVTDAVTFTVGP